jgi:50S ribosomal protein uL3/50S ribosomal protein L4
MVTGIIGKKVGMTQIFGSDGVVRPGTVIKAGPCVIVQAKALPTDGYEAVQLGLVEERPARVNKPLAGHYQKAHVPPTRVRREVKVAPGGEPVKPGDHVLVSLFADGDRVDVIGVSRGKGYQGVVKRHHFRGGAATHGSMFHRAPGSIGASSFPSRVIKGMRAAGRMGGDRVTVRNLKVLKVDVDNHLLVLQGAVPGAAGGYLVIRKAIAAKPVRIPQPEKVKGRNEPSVPTLVPASAAPDAIVRTAMTIDVVNGQNEKVGSVELRDEVFGGRVKTHLIWESVVRQNAAERRGTHATKNRALVSGSGKKPWRQKGTGRARVRDIRTPLWRKGGTVFGPQPRSYDYRLPRKVERGALRAALAQRVQDGDVTVVEAFVFEDAKTKAAAEMLRGFGVGGRKTLLVDVHPDEMLVRCTRNLPGVRCVPSGWLTARDVMDTTRLIVTRAAIARLEQVLSGRKGQEMEQEDPR